jgi:hypothetical protein
MHLTSKLCCALAIVAATATVASAADGRRHVTHHRAASYSAAPYAFGGAYASAGGSERRYGTSVPYDASGPAYDDFQLQGR